MYEDHFKKLEQLFGKFSHFPEASYFERCILLLKNQHMNYAQIQKYLGNPSKKIIRDVILKYAPSWLETDCNHHKLQSNVNLIEKRIIGLIKKYNWNKFDLDEFDECVFNVDNNHINFNSEDGNVYNFNDFDERTQLSILYNIAKILNIDIKSTEFNK